MTESFIYDSEHLLKDGLCSRLKILFHIKAYSKDDAGYEIKEIWNMDSSEYVELTSLPAEEQKEIELKCQKLADENSVLAYFEMLQTKGEDLYDFWKENR